MDEQKNLKKGDLNVQSLNEGVNYMEKQEETRVEGAVPTNNQPMVNTEAVKARANQVAGKARNLATDYVEKVKTDRKYLIVTAVIVVVILALLFGKMLMPGSGVVRSYMSGMKKYNAEKIVKLYHEDMYEDEDDEIDDLEERFEELEDEDFKYTSYKIRECEKYSKDELDDLAESLESLYDIDEDDVKAARTYWVRYKYDEDGDKGIGYRSVTVVKIEGKWYLMG